MFTIPTNVVDPFGLLDSATPWDLGLEWLTGKGQRIHHFTDGDQFKELLRQHQHIQELINRVCNGSLPPSGKFDYELGSLSGVPRQHIEHSRC